MTADQVYGAQHAPVRSAWLAEQQRCGHDRGRPLEIVGQTADERLLAWNQRYVEVFPYLRGARRRAGMSMNGSSRRSTDTPPTASASACSAT